MLRLEASRRNGLCGNLSCPASQRATGKRVVGSCGCAAQPARPSFPITHWLQSAVAAAGAQLLLVDVADAPPGKMRLQRRSFECASSAPDACTAQPGRLVGWQPVLPNMPADTVRCSPAADARFQPGGIASSTLNCSVAACFLVQPGRRLPTRCALMLASSWAASPRWCSGRAARRPPSWVRWCLVDPSFLLGFCAAVAATLVLWKGGKAAAKLGVLLFSVPHFARFSCRHLLPLLPRWCSGRAARWPPSGWAAPAALLVHPTATMCCCRSACCALAPHASRLCSRFTCSLPTCTVACTLAGLHSDNGGYALTSTVQALTWKRRPPLRRRPRLRQHL